MIVLDTHVWIWWVSQPERLSSPARSAIEYSESLGICPISCWEISTKQAQGKLSLDRDLDVWMAQALSLRAVRLLDISSRIAIQAGQLRSKGFHGDPADQLITATAQVHGAELVTKDKAIRSFEAVRTVW